MSAVRTMVLAAALLCAGCEGVSWWGGTPRDFVKPTVAVMKFENRAPFPLGWNLGDGMADMLVDRLVATNRYHVIERPELDSVLREQKLQNSGATREQNKVAVGRIKNVQYLIKGTITDFGHVANNSGFAGGWNWDLFGNTARAVMGLTVYVVDVESGEIICSETINESVGAQTAEVKAAYSGVAFGGRSFYQTPLGKASARVLDRAIRRVTETIASQPWTPKIAMVQPDNSIIINGGADRDLKAATDWEVVETGTPIFDPDSGDVLGHQPDRLIGKVRVVQVQEKYSVATITSGKVVDMRPGLRCRRLRTVAERP